MYPRMSENTFAINREIRFSSYPDEIELPYGLKEVY